MIRFFIAVAAASLVGACGLVTGDYALLSTPGRFDSLACEELTKQYDAAVLAERQEAERMQRNMADPAGYIVNLLVYSSPLASKRSDVQRLQQAAAEKNCDLAAPRPGG